MTHPLATDPHICPALRRAFATVTHQIVRHYSDGSEWSYNLNRVQTPDRETIAERERIRIGTLIHGRTLASIEIREI
jgi:hypothetical protein